MRKYTDIIKYHCSQIWDYFFYNRAKSLKHIEKKIPLEYKHLEHVVTWEYSDDPNGYTIDNIVNNKWGEWKVKKGNYFQTISKKGWRFLTPWKNYGVLGFPSVVSKGFLPNLNFSVDYSVLFVNNKKRYNLAFDFWVLSSKQWSWENVVAEIMIWEDYNISRPAGRKRGEITTSQGVKYTLYSTWIDKSSENLGVPGWYLFTFVRKKPLRKDKKQGAIKFEDFWKQLPTPIQINHLHNIEFGTEVYNSDGLLVVEHFDLKWE